MDMHLLQQKIQKLLKTCVAAKSIVSFSLEHDTLSIQFSPDRRLVLADPTAPVRNPRGEDRIIRQVRSPGHILMDAILVDRLANVAVTDFFQSELAPCELDFVTMELDARVRESGTEDLLNILEMEQELAGLDELSATLSAASVDPQCRKSLAMIFTIRHLAQQVFQSNLEDYRIGLYHVSLMRLAQWDGEIKYAPQELVQYLHYLLICGFIANRGERGTSDAHTMARHEGIFIDEDNHEVRLNGRVISLTPTEYDLLSYLHQRHGNLCRREEIMRDVFKIDANDPVSEKSLLNTHMGRLRTKIETDLDNPQYLQTIRGQGYKLVKPPQ
jgi:DNA-binding winged helix-turn-helix (wHTH) protein